MSALEPSLDEVEKAVSVMRARSAEPAQDSLLNNIKPPADGGQQVLLRVDPLAALWADHRVRLLWRGVLDFSDDGTWLTGMGPCRRRRPLRERSAGRPGAGARAVLPLAHRLRRRDPLRRPQLASVARADHRHAEPARSELAVEDCRSELLRHEYDASPPAQWADEAVRQFPTMVGSTQFAALRNRDEIRTCKECGHVNSPFPVEGWGRPRQVRRTTAVRAAEAAMREAAVTDA